VDTEVERVWKGSWYVEVISQKWPVRTDYNHENMSEYLVSRPSIEPVTCTANMRRLAVPDNMLDSTKSKIHKGRDSVGDFRRSSEGKLTLKWISQKEYEGV